MNRLWLVTILLVSVLAMAQTREGDDAADGTTEAAAAEARVGSDEAGSAENAGIPATEVEVAEGAQAPAASLAGEAENAEGAFSEEDLIPAGVEEQAPPAPPEQTADPEEEFTPEDEISEDYPVPLPSDI